MRPQSNNEKERDDRGVGEHNTFDEIQYSRKVKYIIVRMQESAIIKVNFHCDLIEPVLKILICVF